MKILFLIVIGMTITVATSAQGDFKKVYEQFRFGLHNEIEHTDFKLSESTANSIDEFLEENSKKIVQYRNHQLQIYQRASLEDAQLYKSMDKDELETLKSNLVWYDSGILQSKLQAEGYNSQVAGHIESMLDLMSVDPIYKINLINGQVMSMVLMQHQQLEAAEMANIYGKIGIGGVYLSTHKVDADHWNLIYNNYYLIFQYEVNVKTGAIALLDVRMRK